MLLRFIKMSFRAHKYNCFKRQCLGKIKAPIKMYDAKFIVCHLIFYIKFHIYLYANILL